MFLLILLIPLGGPWYERCMFATTFDLIGGNIYIYINKRKLKITLKLFYNISTSPLRSVVLHPNWWEQVRLILQRFWWAMVLMFEWCSYHLIILHCTNHTLIFNDITIPHEGLSINSWSNLFKALWSFVSLSKFKIGLSVCISGSTWCHDNTFHIGIDAL